MQRIQISRPSSPAVVPWLRQLVASNHVGAPRRTISLSNHSPHGHIAPKVPSHPPPPLPLAAKHIPLRKKLRTVPWLTGQQSAIIIPWAYYAINV